MLAAGLDDRRWDQLALAMPGLKERAKTLVELLDSAHFLFASRPIPIDEKAAKVLTHDVRARLASLMERLSGLESWTTTAVEAEAREFAHDLGIKLGDVAHPLRAALTGRTASPGIFDVLFVLGREESLGRMADQAAPR